MAKSNKKPMIIGVWLGALGAIIVGFLGFSFVKDNNNAEIQQLQQEYETKIAVLQKELSQCEQDIKVEVFSTNEATLLATETVPVTSGKEATEEVDNNTEDGDAIVEAEPEEALEETVDISDADIEEEIDESEVTMAENQQVSWGPAKGQAAGICVDPDCNELIIWEQLKQEMETSILPKLTDLPPDSQIMLKDYKDKKDWIVIIADENGKEIANVWFGANPLNKWKYDGLIRIGTPKAPVKLFGTFERYSDGYYEFNNE